MTFQHTQLIHGTPFCTSFDCLIDVFVVFVAIADIVAGACLPLCAAIFESPLPSAHGACLKADRCPD